MSLYVKVGDRVVEIPATDAKGKPIDRKDLPTIEKHLAKATGLPVAEVRTALAGPETKAAPAEDGEGKQEREGGS